MVAEDSILPATAVQKKPAADLLSDYWDGWDCMKKYRQGTTYNILTSLEYMIFPKNFQFYSFDKSKNSLKSYGRFNRTLKFFVTIYDRIGLIWSALLAC